MISTEKLAAYSAAMLRIAKTQPGWSAQIYPIEAPLFEVTTELRCPHGGKWPTSVTPHLLEETVTHPNGLVGFQFEQAVLQCIRNCGESPILHIFPAGTAVESVEACSPPSWFGYGPLPAPEDTEVKITLRLKAGACEAMAKILCGKGSYEPVMMPSPVAPALIGTMKNGDLVFNGLKKLVPTLFTKDDFQCPRSPGDWVVLYPSRSSRGTLASIIMHLNDVHRWTREQIADWLESIDVDLTIQTEGAA